MDKKNLQQLLDEANDRIYELEEELEESKIGVIFSESEKVMLEIIQGEIGRINRGRLADKMLDKDDVKIFDTLVKDFVAIRGKLPIKKSENNENVSDDIRGELSILYGDK